MNKKISKDQFKTLFFLQLELCKIEKIYSFYTNLLSFLAQYSFIFDEKPAEIKTVTPDPARDGSNWYGYAGQNPITYVDPMGLAYYTGPTGASVQSSNTPVTPHESSETRGSSGGPTKIPTVSEAQKQFDTYLDYNLWNDTIFPKLQSELHDTFDLDFGYDFLCAANDAINNGYYLNSVGYGLDMVAEFVFDIFAAYYGAAIIGAGIEGLEAAIASKSVTSGYLEFKTKINQNILSVTSKLNSGGNSSRKYATALNFYKNAGFSEVEAIDHMQGIDFDKKVQVKKLKKGSFVEQWQNPGFPQGKYYCPIGTNPDTLGINTEGRIKTMYQLKQDTYVLQTTAKNTIGNSNLPIWAQGKGGGIQFFTTEQQNLIEVR